MMNQDKQIDAFARLAREYCDWAETRSDSPVEEVRNAQRLLPQLYSGAVLLPKRDGEDVDSRSISHDDWLEIFGRFGCLPLCDYWVVLDPFIETGDDFEDHDMGISSIADDLADIWRDLKEGLELCDSGYTDAAVWCWRFNFFHHWGEHASRALHMLHVWISENSSFFDSKPPEE